MGMVGSAIAKADAPDWTGLAGARWASNVDFFEMMLADVGTSLLARAAFTPGEKVVEIGCGGGGFTIEIGNAVGPEGTVLGLDISDELVTLAKARAVALSVGNVDFETGDAQTAMPAGIPYDRLISRFGVMFFFDPAAAMANLHAMIRPGGRLDFAVWAPAAVNPQFAVTAAAASAHLEIEKPDPRAPGPLAFCEPDYVRELLEGGGFRDVSFDIWRGYVKIGSKGMTALDGASKMLEIGTIADKLAKVKDVVRQAIRQDLAARLRPYVTDAGLAIPAEVYFVQATA
jgi:SAM-dependent methyltransferase